MRVCSANVKILCLSDRVEPMLQGPKLNSYARGVEAVVSCGDLPFDYLEYVVTFLGAPVYYVLGNDDPAPGFSTSRSSPPFVWWAAVSLVRQFVTRCSGGEGPSR
jgi:hypothetical protein